MKTALSLDRNIGIRFQLQVGLCGKENKKVRKMFRLTVLIALVLLVLCVCTAQADEQLPAGIRDHFTGNTFASAENKDSTHRKLTKAPTLPDGSDLKATEIKFTGGKKYEVYSAPDKNSIRGGNGKAKVSTNGWIQVFGKENGWILIQYSIDSEHYRFGYISEKALPKKAAVEDLQFSPVSAVIDHPVSVTDDPLFSQSTLTTFTGGETVSWLATMGNWAYIEGTDFRGFIPADALAFPASIEEGYEIYTGNDGEQYDLFEIRKLFYDENHKVYAVSGVYERIVLDDDCYSGKIAENGAFTYDLAPDFQAMMVDPETGDLAGPFVPVTDLYSWYIDTYMVGEKPESGDLIFKYDLPEDERENADVDFWFITTRIRLNDQQQIEHMRYYYVPWG